MITPSKADFVPPGYATLADYFIAMGCPSELAEDYVEEMHKGDIGFLCMFNNMKTLAITFDLMPLLKNIGSYEKALIDAFTSCRVNNHHWSLGALRFLFNHADRAKLLAAGDPLPGPGPFTLYRGVSGYGHARRLEGYSWTSSPEKALWFARRLGLAHPAVYRIEAPAEWVLAHVTDREEQEFIMQLPRTVKLTSVDLATIKDCPDREADL